jgi:hypothetical protein
MLGALLGPLLGGGLGLLGSLFGNKPQQTNTGFDPATQQYIGTMRGDAQSLYGQLDPSQVMQMLQQIQGYGNIGMGALAGNKADVNQMMGPGSGLLNQIYDRQQQQGITAMQQQAQLAGGTGMGGNANSRAGIPLGNFMSGMGATRAQGMLGLLQQMYQNAGLLSGYGMNATTQMGQLPLQYAQGKMGILQQGLRPYGTQTTVPTQTNPFAGILGGLLAGSQIFNPQQPKSETGGGV